MRRRTANILAIGVMVATMGAAHGQDHPSPAATKPSKQQKPHQAKAKRSAPYQIGRASWYGKRFNGRKTASGEAYDMFQFTAAHRQLPLGTLVRVTNLRNRESVVVRINDRGPVPQTRVIDLSYGAARMLDLQPRGVEMVRLEVLNPEEPAVASLVGMP
jgi:rare lipoprotein A